MIYVANPYSDSSKQVMKWRYEVVKKFTAELLVDGAIAYSPIVHGHVIASSHELPRDWAFWQRHCLGMLRKADQMIVLCLPGFETSVGVKAEIDFCEQVGIPIVYEYNYNAEEYNYNKEVKAESLRAKLFGFVNIAKRKKT